MLFHDDFKYIHLKLFYHLSVRRVIYMYNQVRTSILTYVYLKSKRIFLVLEEFTNAVYINGTNVRGHIAKKWDIPN